MNHTFNPNPSHSDKCLDCGYPAFKHGLDAPCDCCDKTGDLVIFGKNNQQMLLHPDCMEAEKAIIEKYINSAEGRQHMAEFQSVPNQEQRLANYQAISNPYDKLIRDAKRLDEQLHLSSDIFTAKTTDIESVRLAIWADSNVLPEKKFFEFVAFCKDRIIHFQSVIFDLDKRKIEAYSEQKAWHIAMNDYANKLRTEEREQLRINDVTYDVKTPKSVTPRAITLSTKKFGKKEIRDAVVALAIEIGKTGSEGILEYSVQNLITSKNWTLEQAINHLRRSLKEGLSESAK